MDLAQYFNTMNTLKLKQIIKEEVEKALKDTPSPEFAPIESALDNFYRNYLAKDLRLTRKITNEERIERLQTFMGILKEYIDKCEMGIDEENSWISLRGKNMNEGENGGSEAQKLHDALKKAYERNEKKGRAASISGLRKDPRFQDLKKLDSALAKKLDSQIASEDAMDR